MSPDEILKQIEALVGQLAEAIGPEAAKEALMSLAGPSQPEPEAQGPASPEAGIAKARQAM